MRKLPPLTALRAFEAAARHKSFKAAADELRLTPTAVSHQIRALEILCERPLFRRRPRPIALTEAGARLFPAIRDGLDQFAAAFGAIREDAGHRPLRVTTTNAFAGRWLVPRLPLWRAAHPDTALEVIGTDAVVDLRAGDADVAIRYAHAPPPDLRSEELFRDRFWPVCSPRLLSAGPPIEDPASLERYPLIHAWWSEADPAAPTWVRWLAMARGLAPDALLATPPGLHFREELHAIDAIIAGQGIGICSDILVEAELASGALAKVADIALPGFGFYLAYVPNHPRQALIATFAAWIRLVA
jgi:LysR family glycine cleavage system transcriptional activator